MRARIAEGGIRADNIRCHLYSQYPRVTPVSVEWVVGEFSRMTHHLNCIALRDDQPSLNAQGYNTVP
jgi:hypothetical protein